ncbi:MAG: hypothetical protein ACLFQX_05235 [Candidatus Kapaibacterium sp.]
MYKYIILIMLIAIPMGALEYDFNVSGPLSAKDAQALTADSRVGLISIVPAEHDYRVVYWGFGTIDRENMSYSIDLTAAPPDTALLYGAFTAAYIAIINDPSIAEGEVRNSYEHDLIHGAAERHMVIFVANADHEIMKEMWLPRFLAGYNLGQSVRDVDEAEGGMDALENVHPDKSVPITVAPFNRLDMINWF